MAHFNSWHANSGNIIHFLPAAQRLSLTLLWFQFSSGDFCFLAILVCSLVLCSFIICLVIIFLFEFKSYVQVLLVLAIFACKFYLKISLAFQDFEKIGKYYIFLKFCIFSYTFEFRENFFLLFD